VLSGGPQLMGPGANCNLLKLYQRWRGWWSTHC